MREDVTVKAIKAIDDKNRTVYMIGYSCYDAICIFNDSGSSQISLVTRAMKLGVLSVISEVLDFVKVTLLSSTVLHSDIDKKRILIIQ